MRFQVLLLLVLLSLAGISAAQDTNFSQGPQYLITGSTAVLYPISTPIVSLGAPLTLTPDTNFSQGPQYLATGDATFLHPISTPILSLDAPLPSIPSLPEVGPPVTDQPYVSNPDLRHEANLFPIYYGYPMIPVIELTGGEPSQPLPASITGVGYPVIADPQTLRERGYGVTVSEAASYWKAHKTHVSRVYTNADIEPLAAQLIERVRARTSQRTDAGEHSLMGRRSGS